MQKYYFMILATWQRGTKLDKFTTGTSRVVTEQPITAEERAICAIGN